jgi:hypothetical protein
MFSVKVPGREYELSQFIAAQFEVEFMLECLQPSLDGFTEGFIDQRF